MICASCGVDNRDEARFCAHCGHSFVVPAGAPPTLDAALPTQASVPATFGRSTVPPQADKASVWQKFVLGLAALPLLFFGVGSMFSFSPGWSWLFILAGAGFVYAAVRPQPPILRRIAVALAFLVLFLLAAAIAMFVFWISLNLD